VHAGKIEIFFSLRRILRFEHSPQLSSGTAGFAGGTVAVCIEQFFTARKFGFFDRKVSVCEVKATLSCLSITALILLLKILDSNGILSSSALFVF
jgi:hypothetical protein